MATARRSHWLGLGLLLAILLGTGLGDFSPAAQAMAEGTGPAPEPVRSLPTVPPPTSVPPPEQSPNGIDGRINGPLHTAVILQGASDELAIQKFRPQVTKILATTAQEIWARATDAQVTAMLQQGLPVEYRDGVDLMHCFDIRRHPQAPRQPPPPPFRNSQAPSVFLVQLDVPTTALPDFMDVIASAGLTLLQTEEATLTIQGSAAAVAKLPHVVWTAPYGVRERVLTWAVETVGAPPADGAGCGWSGGNPATVDRILRKLGDWIAKAPAKSIKLNAVLFRKSSSFNALIRRLGGHFVEGSYESLTITVPRQALPELAAHPDLRELSSYAMVGPA